MPTSAERLHHVTAKFKRAKQHLSELEHLHRTLFQSNPYKVATKRDPQTRKLIYYVSGVEQPGEGFATTVGDCPCAFVVN